jgi:uncharacterized protein (DUF486 family)
MNAYDRKPWFRTVILFGAVYFVIGITSIALAGGAGSTHMRDTWRGLSFLTSGVAFAVHIGYEHFRLVNSPRTAATHVSLAVAIGAFALAVSANVHGHWVHSSQQRLLALALVAWPVLTGVPAFVVALVAAALLGLRRRRS